MQCLEGEGSSGSDALTWVRLMALALAAACSWKPRDSIICPKKLDTAIASRMAESAGDGHTAGEG